MFLVLLTFSPLFINNVFANNTRVNFDGCKRAVTLGYGYKTMYHLREAGEHSDGHLMLEFYVKTSSDAHVLLAKTENPTELDPAYEIVIGGGRNTFSAIRNKGRKASGTHSTTLNILSSDEYRGFWIKLSARGHLEVGKTGVAAPILFWDDPNPLVVRYFGFCNWANFIGQWAYSCPNETQADKVPTNLSTLQKLRFSLLQHYDPYNRPVIKVTDITTLYIQLMNKAVKLDEKKSTMYVMADVYMQWQDQKIQWDPAQYGNISKLTMAYHEIWQPDLMLFNAVGSGTGFLADEIMSVTTVGFVKWKSHIEVEVHCNLDLSEWPYDKQICELQLGFWGENKYLRLLYGNEPEEKAQQTNSEWEIVKLHYENINIRTPWKNTTDDSREAAMAIRYVLKRNYYMYKAVFGVPLLVVTFMTLLPFWISPLHPHKLHISCLSLIVMSIFVVTLARTLPAPADHIPGLVQTYSHGMVAVTISILISVAIITMARSNHERPIPQIVHNLITGKYVQFIIFLSAMPNKDPSDYGNLLEAENTDQVDSTNDITPVDNIQQQWLSLAKLIDRVAFIVYFIYFSTVFFKQI